MAVLETFRRHRRYQQITYSCLYLFLVYDAYYGTLLRDAYGDVSRLRLLLWPMLSLQLLLAPWAVGITIISFQAILHPRFWTEGGREQFAHAKGYAVATYTTIVTFLGVLLLSQPYLNVALSSSTEDSQFRS